MNCELCSETNVPSDHETTEKHIRNKSLFEYSQFKKQNVGNKKGIIVSCTAKSLSSTHSNCFESKIKVSAKPNEVVTFNFNIFNDNDDAIISLNFIHMMHNQLNFIVNNHGIEPGAPPHHIQSKSELDKEIKVVFRSAAVGEYVMPVIFGFFKNETKENILILRDMIVYIEETKTSHHKLLSPFAAKNIKADQIYSCVSGKAHCDVYFIPKAYKPIFSSGLQWRDDMDKKDKKLIDELRNIFDTGVTKENYVRFFHNLLWYEETAIKINLKNYNMSGVEIMRHESSSTSYRLTVPGLAEKRPSLLVGDLLLIKPEKSNVMFEALISKIDDNNVTIHKLSPLFRDHYNNNKRFDVRFSMSRVIMERMHEAVNLAASPQIQTRLFPQYNSYDTEVETITDFFNPVIAVNPEQRSAVQNIVSGSSGLAPYLVHGPPGTGKTITIVEAILQLVSRECRNRILVCTDSNMAADHVATMLIKYADQFPKNFLLRANSEFRPWETLPKSLIPFSNGSKQSNFHSVSITEMMCYMIVVTTLSHAAKYGLNQAKKSRHITHLFIDEAAQASEPGALVPICGLLSYKGSLVLAGDPLQLGPVVISQKVKLLGLGLSLMERLMNSFPQYDDEKSDPKYIVMLRNNFRSNPDILSIPNELFYKGQLNALADEDEFSKLDITGERKTSRAIVFHGVLSQEQKIGMSPSFYNNMELEVVQMYVNLLLKTHNVKMEDIGIITPYIRQVSHIKKWLSSNQYDKIEAGTVESFQGKEKKIIIVSTVRANSNLLQHDAKFQLGFLVDDKRFNVAVTRAKAKLIIVGNPLCLEKDKKWRMYMQKCREFGTYFGFDTGKVNINDNINIIDQILPLFREMKTCTIK